MVAGLEQRGMAVTYVVYPDEGDQLRRMENVLDFHARPRCFSPPASADGPSRPMAIGCLARRRW